MLLEQKKSPIQDEKIGRSRGGLSSKIHALVNAQGVPVSFYLSAGQVHDSQCAEILLESKKANFVIGDRAYAGKKIRNKIASIGAEPVIPPHQSTKKKDQYYDKDLYKQRNIIERFFNKLKQFRAIATRYCKRGVFFLSAIKFAASIIILYD